MEGDGVGYYVYLHAAFVSHSLDLGQEYASAIKANVPLYMSLVTTHTSTGHLADFFPVGPAILSSPAYLVALAIRPSGEPQFGSPFIEAFSFASLVYGLLALALCYRLALSSVGSRWASLTGVIGGTLATPMVYYLLSEPSYSHTFSVFCVSLFLYAWWKGPPQKAIGWFWLGVLGGLMALNRFQDGLLLAIVLLDIRRFNWKTILLLPGVLLAFAPQLAFDHVQYGGWLPERPPGQPLDFVHGNYVNVLFASSRGLLVSTPITLVAAAGVLMIKQRRLQLAAAAAFIIEVVVEGAVGDLGGASFGARRLLDLLPFIVMGIAGAAHRVGPRVQLIGVAAFAAWNLTLLAAYEYTTRTPTPAYLDLLRDQWNAIPDIPLLFAKGNVVRDLLLWRAAGKPFDPTGGFTALAIETAAVLVAVGIALRRPRPDAKPSHSL